MHTKHKHIHTHTHTHARKKRHPPKKPFAFLFCIRFCIPSMHFFFVYRNFTKSSKQTSFIATFLLLFPYSVSTTKSIVLMLCLFLCEFKTQISRSRKSINQSKRSIETTKKQQQQQPKIYIYSEKSNGKKIIDLDYVFITQIENAAEIELFFNSAFLINTNIDYRCLISRRQTFLLICSLIP